MFKLFTIRRLRTISCFSLAALAMSLCLTTGAAAAPTSPTTKTVDHGALLDKRMESLLHRWAIPGAVVAIMQDDKVLLSRGYGWADTERHVRTNPNSVFRIASVSKAITAVTIMHLVQQHRLHLDDKVFKILDNLHPLTDAPPRPGIYKITVRNLLEMSSGWITSKGTDPMFGPWSRRMMEQLGYTVPPDCTTAARMMMTIPQQFAPGTQYSYSNINYCLLGLIINKVTGQPGQAGYEAYVKQALLAPYGITSMHIGDNHPVAQTGDEVKYYYYHPAGADTNIIRQRDGLPYGSTDILKKNYADGGWVASATDLAKFLQAFGKHKILTADLMAVMAEKPAFQKNPSSYFSMGWSMKHLHGHRYYTKTGSFTGTQAYVMCGDDGVSYVALFNAKPAQRHLFVNQLQNILLAYTNPDHVLEHTPALHPAHASKHVKPQHPLHQKHRPQKVIVKKKAPAEL